MQNKLRLPRVLDADLNEITRAHPVKLSAILARRACSTAQMTLPGTDPPLSSLPFAELYSARGSLGIFRVYSSADSTDGSVTYSLRHAIDTLRDSVWRQQTDFSGTVEGFLSELLSYQVLARWQLGVCEDTGNYKRKSINYDHLDDLLDEVRENRTGYYFTYDFSTTPWTLNLVADAGTVNAEMRRVRNLDSASLRRTRDGMANRLHLTVTETNQSGQEQATRYQYDDAASQAAFGVIEGTAGIDAEEYPDRNAWAAQYLADHARPLESANCEGWEIVKETGEAWDAFDIGKLARVAVPGKPGWPFELPIEVLRFDGLAGDAPEKVRAELQRRLPKFSERLADTQKTAKKAEKNSGQTDTRQAQDTMMIGLLADAVGMTRSSDGAPVMDPNTGRPVYDETAAEALKNAIKDFGTATVSGRQVTIPTVKFDGTAGPNIVFTVP